MTSLTELFCDVDDFWQAIEPYWRAQQLSDGKQRDREGTLHPSEIMTILILFSPSTLSRLQDLLHAVCRDVFTARVSPSGQL